MKKAGQPPASLKFETSSSIRARREHTSLEWGVSFDEGQAGHSADVLAVAEVLHEL